MKLFLLYTLTTNNLVDHLIELGIHAGKNILTALTIYIIGRWLIRICNKLVTRFLKKTNWDIAVKDFVGSMINVLLIVLLAAAIISALGVDTTSLAALLASAGVAIGMALSGNLSNFAGGLVVLLFKPYKIGDWIEVQDYMGKVMRIEIFHTVIETVDMQRVYIPNSLISTAVVINRDQSNIRRPEWIVSITYGNNVEHARQLIEKCLLADKAILKNPQLCDGTRPAPYTIHVHNLNASSVDLRVRAYCLLDDYFSLRHRMTETFYDAITKDPLLDFPFNTQTIEIVKAD